MKKYAIIGTGARGYFMFGQAIVQRYADSARLVGLFDPNPKRAAWVRDQLDSNIPLFDDVAQMLAQAQPDVVIVTSVDRFHSQYIQQAFEAGCEVICEKPLATTQPMLLDILRAEQVYKKKVAVTFNCRFMPYYSQVKALLQDAPLGRILSVHFEYLLDRSHGADYFRRWHRLMENSGGLLVHKATHHFDIVNWLLEQDPVSVMAHGSLGFYGNNREERGHRCSTCPHRDTCEVVFRDQSIPYIQHMYFDAEEEDGYLRDSCVFADEIDIYDTMSLCVAYSGGTLMNYSLIAHSPYEGWRMSINGTKGRMEIGQMLSGVHSKGDLEEIRLYDAQGKETVLHYPKGQGSHGGGDEKLLRMLLGGQEADPLGQFAGSREGVLSAIIGIAANQSIKNQAPVFIPDLLPPEVFAPSK